MQLGLTLLQHLNEIYFLYIKQPMVILLAAEYTPLNHSTNMAFTLEQLIGFSAIIIAVLSAWISMRVRAQKTDAKTIAIEESTKLQIIELEKRLEIKMVELGTRIVAEREFNTQWVTNLKNTIEAVLADNRQEHRDISHDVKGVRQSIQLINLKLTEIQYANNLKVSNQSNIKTEEG